MRRAGALFLLLWVVLVLAPPPGAQEKAPPSAAGYWEGNIELRDALMGVRVHLSDGDAGWTGKIDIVVQGIRDVPLENISVNGAEVRFTMQGVMGDPTFAGMLSDDGKTIVGSLQHSTQSMAFSLERRETPFPDDSDAFAAYLKAGVPGEGPAGVWRGILNAGLAKLRLDLNITQADDGTFSGTVSSPDQGSVVLPIDSIIFEGESLTFTVVSVGGHFEGKMGEDGSAVTGSWSQARMTYPMLFRRQAREETMTSDGSGE